MTCLRNLCRPVDCAAVVPVWGSLFQKAFVLQFDAHVSHLHSENLSFFSILFLRQIVVTLLIVICSCLINFFQLSVIVTILLFNNEFPLEVKVKPESKAQRMEEHTEVHGQRWAEILSS